MHYFTPKRCANTQKIMYHDKVQAQRAADRSLVERGAELWVYRCEYCGQWHLTHHDPSGAPLLRGLKPSGGGRPRSRKRGFKPRRH
ncbi:hypothetical protein GA0061078_0773 [Bifidobacterium bohemicum]|uniref:Uncharacterized protein n=1 Tax=Bifidobacterium bohemicum DSM 22767 TaxID=1437606 RepID=A0A086ZF63_9BIFI|nr:hypothetical protein [Bifidobacterium bohemicum]KFI45163.1 hypothetical protein BBOH_1425 [Bifidobacterium bohemicum DSM 22767]SCB90052.1 hypothetical protein GA0061078_0773 [Bifidobacterium bohemicum]